jgi:hypothetical protein
MATAVRLFTHRGLVSTPITVTNRDSKDSVYMLEQPYLAAEALTATATALSSATATAPATTSILRVEIDDGKTIRYEINPPARAVAASASSPSLSGKDQFHFGVGWTISVIEGP